MARPRAYSFCSVIFYLTIFILGFSAGLLGIKYFLSKNNFTYLKAGSTITRKRFLAIKEALEKGEKEYTFEVKGFYPVLNQ